MIDPQTKMVTVVDQVIAAYCLWIPTHIEWSKYATVAIVHFKNRDPIKVEGGLVLRNDC